MSKKAKKMTFRQRLRAQSEDRLKEMVKTVQILVVESVKPVSEINPYDVMRLACGKQTKSLRNRLIGELANEHEAELEKIYNKQQDLSFGTKEDDDAETQT